MKQTPKNPTRTVRILKQSGNVLLKEIAIVWGATPYVFYEIQTEEKTIKEKNYFTAGTKFLAATKAQILINFINA